ncbi:hypothetical protein ACFOLJ_30980 [Rugamonas sp. CCM 8940]|uniref:hypothetical protein n=1 Tax=Rugamonas sp. CCM 8940 TaxID=2765359 RepID=UPI0018F6338B|nr:hypothetical protein [Rugamonas sp. CCM 8940]MBJ7309222.1 hypothetical protein [Rugamonas sp. CCM 8940]
MTIQANAQGVLSGRFQIPANVPAGTKSVEFTGAGGTRGAATFSGQGLRVTEVRQMVTRITSNYYDPLAQTFTLPQATALGGVKLWFTVKGTAPVMVQIRGVAAGVPNRVIYAEARIDAADIKTVGPTQIVFAAPAWIDANTEYALVVLTSDDKTQLAVAEVGMWDDNAQRRVTAQPYQVGVLLSSSNASSWTPHQDRDMTFELQKAVFSETVSTVSLGNVSVTNATDLLLLALAEAPTFESRVEYTLALPGGAKINVAEGQPVRLATPVSGDIGVSARLAGTAAVSPVLHPGTQLISGAVQTTADYVSVAFPAGANSRIRVIVDAALPSGAKLVVILPGAGADNKDVEVPFLSSRPLSLEKQELSYEVAGINKDSVKVKLVLSGSASARPELENLRAMAL